MAFDPQNFIDQQTVVSAEWLNEVDVTVNGALQGVTTTAELIALVGGGGGGSPGQNAVVLVANAPSLVVQASSSGVVADFSQANGQIQLFDGQTDVTSLAVLSIVNNACTATVNQIPNTPVFGPVGFYQFSALPGLSGSATIIAIYLGQTYQVKISIAKVLAGSTGPSGGTGPAGPPGTPATPGLNIVLSKPSVTVLAYANGGVPSFSGIDGQASLLDGAVDQTAATTWSAVGAGLAGTINTSANVPVNGHPIGYYQVTAMTQPVGTLTITGVFSGTTLQAVFTVTQVPTGYEIVSVLPTTNLFQGRIVFLTTDNQLYRYTGTGWTTAVPALSITGTLTAAQIASLAASQITGQLTAAQIASIGVAQLTGQITSSQITPGAITTPLLAAGAVNTAALAAGSVVAATIASGTITAAQIAGGTITGANIAAGTILAGNIAADTITGGNIAANTITASEMAANSITTNAVQAGAITAAKIGVTQLSAIAADIGTVTAGLLVDSGSTTVLNLNASYLQFNNGVQMLVRGVGFGAGANYLDWFGPTQSNAGNFSACTDNLGIYWLKTDGTYKFGTNLTPSATTLFSTGGTFTYTIPAGKSQIFIELWADTGFGGHGDGSLAGGGGGSGAYCKSGLMISGHAGQTITITLQIGGSLGANSTVTAGTFSMTTMTAPGGQGGSVGAGGQPGAGGLVATGGNLINVPGNSGGNGNGTAAGGQAIPGTYANGNNGGRGAISPTTNNPGLPGICAITAL